MATIIRTINEATSYNTDDVEIEEYWNSGDCPEHKIHSIHSYPAKFPAFIAAKAIDYAKNSGININRISDIFCGCGTVALEAKISNIDFWGCDINPVATLIATVKSNTYKISTLNKHYDFIMNRFLEIEIDLDEYEFANKRIKYWFDNDHYTELKKLIMAINELPCGKYRQSFRCLFSSILKPSSRWLTKSIKPQIDPNKIPISAKAAFDNQYKKYIKYLTNENITSTSKIQIETSSFLKKKNIPQVSLIVTSPPYVTSYEYADLHQLSSLWLGYTDDYTSLRKGTIGSIHNSEEYCFEVMELNQTGRKIVDELGRNPSIANLKVKSIARYYIDMQYAVKKCYGMLEKNGLAFFVIGDTEYKGIKVNNSKHLAESLIQSGFSEVSIAKRKVSNKLLTPYRDEGGRFTNDKSKREVYHEEFVVIAHKN